MMILQCMSVITRCLSAQGFNVYCKGSPEVLQQLCQPESITEDYTQQLSIFAKRGFRIIAVGFKALNPKLNYTKVQRLSRIIHLSSLTYSSLLNRKLSTPSPLSLMHHGLQSTLM
ncbi:hypothetical protein ACLKA6_010346 [Drosophila palustris]